MNNRLLDELEPALLNACLRSLEKHQGETFYSVVLYTSNSWSYFGDSIATIEGLHKAAREYLKKEMFREWQTEEAAVRELKYWTSDLPYHCEFVSEFERVDQLLKEIWEAVDETSEDEFSLVVEEILETAIAALASVRDSGLFDATKVVFNVVTSGSLDPEEYLGTAELLNSPQVLEQLRCELRLN
jgi:hypothetical protein